MRGDDRQQAKMFSYLSPEQRVPLDHPLRVIREMVDRALSRLSPVFEELYSATGRPSIPPEKLLRALLLQVLYTVRSERMLMEELDFNLLFRWFVGLNLDDPVWDVTVFTKDRERLLRGDIADAFFAEVLAEADQHGLLCDEHFTVDGTLIEAWAAHKSFKEIFGWLKTVGLMRKSRHKGVDRVGWMFTFTVAAYNLVRIRNLVGVPAG